MRRTAALKIAHQSGIFSSYQVCRKRGDCTLTLLLPPPPPIQVGVLASSVVRDLGLFGVGAICKLAEIQSLSEAPGQTKGVPTRLSFEQEPLRLGGVTQRE